MPIHGTANGAEILDASFTECIGCGRGLHFTVSNRGSGSNGSVSAHDHGLSDGSPDSHRCGNSHSGGQLRSRLRVYHPQISVEICTLERHPRHHAEKCGHDTNAIMDTATFPSLGQFPALCAVQPFRTRARTGTVSFPRASTRTGARANDVSTFAVDCRCSFSRSRRHGTWWPWWSSRTSSRSLVRCVSPAGRAPSPELGVSG